MQVVCLLFFLDRPFKSLFYPVNIHGNSVDNLYLDVKKV
ncbi:hypothetical protein ADIARSV_3807 [Arcticibacter svalbardensis MN12-7]|uniref:Uncharacterized protein n=1 Tax=Arcticibacter svalbardensis MN12-7 TaxID=1150600 RepID=R9GME0_9SPHI|nr:hypothetical protein ADIARSV_3807 [Arcticibacter svalbardensis MN12-7]